MVILAAALPILLVLVGFLRGFASWQTGLLTLLATGAVASAFFHVSLPTMGRAMATALIPALQTIGILGPALLLYALEEASGGMACLTELACQGAERALLVLLLVLGLSPFLEASCGFGTGIIVCVPLSLTLGLSPRRAALLGLLGESTTAFASMGNAITLEASLTGLPANALGMTSALLLLPFTVGCACLALFLAGGRDAFRHWWPIALLAALLLVAGEWSASLLSVTCAGVLSSLLVSTLLGGLVWWRWQTQTSERQPTAGQWRRRAGLFIPFLVLLSGQLLVHGMAPLSHLAAQSEVVFGGQHWIVADSPGTWLVLACLSVVLLRHNRSIMAQAWRQTVRRLLPLATTLGSFLVISALMQVSGMITTLASLFTPMAGLYLGIAPLLGALGSWMAGSNTSSNALFAPMQIALARQFHLNVLWVGAAQNAAASVGRLVAPLCLYLAASAARVPERTLVLPTWRVATGALLGIETVLVLRFPSAGMIAIAGAMGALALGLLGVQWYQRWQQARRPERTIHLLADISEGV